MTSRSLSMVTFWVFMIAAGYLTGSAYGVVTRSVIGGMALVSLSIFALWCASVVYRDYLEVSA